MSKTLCELSITCITEHTAMYFQCEGFCSDLAKTVVAEWKGADLARL